MRFRCSRCLASLLAAAAMWWPAAARADGPREPAKRVSFQVEAAREVESDWFRARAGVAVEDADAARAAERVNEAMQWALARAKQASGVSVKTGAYSTQPVYDEGRIRRWRASHELLLESGDAEALSALLGDLQQKLELRSFDVSLSEARRGEVEKELVSEALAAFRQRAALIQEGLGASGYAIDQLSLGTEGGPPVPLVRGEAYALARKAPPPAVEGGTTRIAVTLQATIALE